MKGYKAFSKGMVCNGKQYAENTVYEEDGGDICSAGMMHFCKEPFDVLDYYPLVDNNGDFSEFAEVEALDEVKEQGNKCATKKLRIGAKLSFKDFIKASVDVLIEKTKPGENENDKDLSNNGYDGAKIGSSGDMAQIGSSGYCAQIGSSGDGAQIGSSGYCAQIGSSGDGAQIGSSGDGAQIGSSGYCAQIGSSGDGAQIGSSGDWAKIGSSGDRAKIKMGGKRSVSSAIGHNSQISGKKGDWIVLAEWKKDKSGNWYPACVKSGQIDGETLKEDTFYKLENGEFVEG